MPVAVTSKWLESAISTARMREDRGYKYRLHLEHHGDKPTEPVGYFRLSHIESLDVEGSPVATVFADFFRVPQSAFDSIMRGEYPYRSVEISKPAGDPEINTLALLSTHAPFHKYAALDSDTIDVSMTVDELQEAFHGPGLVGSFTGDDGRTVALFHDVSLTEGSMKELIGSLSVAEDGALVLNSSGSSATFRLAESGTPKQGEFSINTPEGPWSVPAVCFTDPDESKKMKALEKENAELKAKLKAIGDKNAAKMAEEDEGEEEKKKKEEAAAKASADTSDSAKFSAMQSALDEVKRERAEEKAEAKAEKEATARFDDSVKSLKGWNLSEKTKAKLVKFAAIGEEALEDFVETYKTNVPKDGPKTLADAVLMGGENSEQANTVAKFLADHPEKADKAEEVCAMYAASPKSFSRPDGTMIPLADVLARETERV